MTKENNNNEALPLYLSILVVILYFMWPYFINAIVSGLNLSETNSLYITFFSNFMLLGVVLFLYFKRAQNPFRKLKNNFKKNMLKSGLIFGIGLIGFCIFNMISYKIAGSLSDSSYNSFQKMPTLFLISTLFYYPIIEELVFKKTFKGIINNKYLFILITGFLNATFQVIFNYETTLGLVYILPYTIFYSSLSYVYYETDNIIYPISYRILYNLIPNIAAIVSSIAIIRIF